MPYLSITDFKYGMDRRRKRVAGVPGTLWKLENAVLSRGGDIERAKKFVPVYDLPAGTFGLAALKDQLYVFGSATEPAGLPVGVLYQRLQHPSTGVMTRLLDAKSFDGKLYAIAEYDDGSVYHYYNGSRVTGWDSIVVGSPTDVAERLALKINADSAVEAFAFGAYLMVTAREAGTAFTLSTGVTNGGADNTQSLSSTTVQANVAPVAEVQAEGTVTITGGTSSPGVNTIEQIAVGSTDLLTEPVDWVSSNAATANALVVAINNAAVDGYQAEAVGAVVTITAPPGTGATANGDSVIATVSGNVAATTGNMAGGVTAVDAVAQVVKVTVGGTIEIEDTFTVTIGSTAYRTTGLAAGMGTAVFVHKQRVWSPAGRVFRYCVLNDATDWVTDTPTSTAAGAFTPANDSDGAQRLVGAAPYSGSAAIFARGAIRIYTLSADADDIAIDQPLDNTGTMAPRSVIGYGNNDVYYLDDTGIRSIRSRDGVDTAYVSDVGSAIDPFVQEVMASVDEDTLSRAVAAIDPLDGRYWVAIGGRIVVLSYFPAFKITAWSYFDPGFGVDDVVRAGRRIYVRSGDTIYAYGGLSGDEYPDDGEQVVTVETAFLSANDPAGFKNIFAMDMACENDWVVDVLIDPNDEDKTVSLGTVNKTTYNGSSCDLPGRAALIAFKMVCSRGGFASISNMALHYNKEPAT